VPVEVATPISRAADNTKVPSREWLELKVA
jgi:hypothetical protein